MRKLTSQKLFRSRKWRLVSVELWNKFAYCPTWTLYNVWSFHKHNSSRFMLIRAFINVSESFNFNKTAKAIFGQLLNTFCNFLYTLVNLYTHWSTFIHIGQLFVHIGQLFVHIGQLFIHIGQLFTQTFWSIEKLLLLWTLWHCCCWQHCCQQQQQAFHKI